MPLDFEDVPVEPQFKFRLFTRPVFDRMLLLLDGLEQSGPHQRRPSSVQKNSRNSWHVSLKPSRWTGPSPTKIKIFTKENSSSFKTHLPKMPSIEHSAPRTIIRFGPVRFTKPPSSLGYGTEIRSFRPPCSAVLTNRLAMHPAEFTIMERQTVWRLAMSTICTIWLTFPTITPCHRCWNYRFPGFLPGTAALLQWNFITELGYMEWEIFISIAI